VFVFTGARAKLQSIDFAVVDTGAVRNRHQGDIIPGFGINMFGTVLLIILSNLIIDQRSTVREFLSSHYQLSTINYQLSILNLQPLIDADRRRSTQINFINRSTINYQLSTINSLRNCRSISIEQFDNRSILKIF
jgi:hypothetical protein